MHPLSLFYISSCKIFHLAHTKSLLQMAKEKQVHLHRSSTFMKWILWAFFSVFCSIPLIFVFITEKHFQITNVNGRSHDILNTTATITKITINNNLNTLDGYCCGFVQIRFTLLYIQTFKSILYFFMPICMFNRRLINKLIIKYDR